MSDRKHILSLTGIRALAAAWVFGFHLISDFGSLFGTGWAYNVYHFVFCGGGMGVELFFVLSGFVLTINYAGRMSAGCTIGEYFGFLKKRIARIYPNHLFVLVILGVIAGGITEGHDSDYSMQGLLKSLFLVHGWQSVEKLFWNVPSWSVSSEWLAYLIFPFLATILIPRLRAAWQVGSGLVFSYVLIVFLMFHFSEGLAATKTIMFPLIRILNFVPGVFLGTAYLKGWGRDLPWTLLGTAAVVGVFIATSQSADSLVTVLLPVVIYAEATGKGPLQKLLSTPTMVYLGKTSYAFYLVQVLVIVGWHRFLPAANGWSVLTKSGFFATVWLANYAVAHIVWSVVEEPSRRFLLQAGNRQEHELARN